MWQTQTSRVIQRVKLLSVALLNINTLGMPLVQSNYWTRTNHRIKQISRGVWIFPPFPQLYESLTAQSLNRLTDFGGVMKAHKGVFRKGTACRKVNKCPMFALN